MNKLVVIFREDVSHLTPDEMVKQAIFATSLFYRDLCDLEFMSHYETKRGEDTSITKNAKEWANEHNGFGDTHLFTASLAVMQELDRMCYNFGTLANIVVNPSLPQKNYFGKKFTTKTATAMYVFIDEHSHEDISKKVQNWCDHLNISGLK
jgi:hypothetical protein